MAIFIKQLKDQGQTIFPQTSAEAVVLKSQGDIITLDKFVNKETTITVDDTIYTVISGHNNQVIKLGSDFKVDEKDGIVLKWNNI